jgi:hypothetical protein
LLDRWVVGVFARWDAFDDLLISSPASGFNMHTVAVGVFAGFRRSIGSLSLDGTAGPEVVVENQEADGAGDGIGGDVSDVRLDFGVRLCGPNGSPTRIYAAGDLDASPARIRHSKRLDTGLPTLPFWSGGVTLGLMWSAL